MVSIRAEADDGFNTEIRRQVAKSVAYPIQCGPCDQMFQDITAYNLHLDGTFHQNPASIENLHWNSKAWEMVPCD